MSIQITERIKKLLRLAADKRGNPHEAERAMAMAFELAEKHRVDVEALDLDEKSAELMHEYFAVGYRYDRLKRGIFGIIQTYFHVSGVLCGPRMMIVGRREDVMIAQYVYDFLRRAGSDCLSKYKQSERSARRKLTTNKRASFISGFIYGIHSTLRTAQTAMPFTDSTKALVVAEEAARDAYFSEKLGKLKALKPLAKPKNETALMAGFRQGAATQINQPLAGSGSGQLLLS